MSVRKVTIEIEGDDELTWWDLTVGATALMSSFKHSEDLVGPRDFETEGLRVTVKVGSE